MERKSKGYSTFKMKRSPFKVEPVTMAIAAGGGKILLAYRYMGGSPQNRSFLRAGKYDASASGKVTWGSAVEIRGQSNTAGGQYFSLSYNESNGSFLLAMGDDNTPKAKGVTVDASNLNISQGSFVTIDT